MSITILHCSFVYWTDWGNHQIERAEMDGKNRYVVVNKAIGWPNGLTIDRPKKRIIWADARTEVGCSIQLIIKNEFWAEKWIMVLISYVARSNCYNTNL